ncbi:hypothetical protein FRX31_005964 [Thalictrum thalictroides]|uniref:Uncharacterized protein n=1 Tax=Thalictrum thalictroides TaxID=46969 RepID=A0A7J6X6G6_THATH|nr:hypothetical protein FRX31_005964 [Thalictrum thalictroides]
MVGTAAHEEGGHDETPMAMGIDFDKHVICLANWDPKATALQFYNYAFTPNLCVVQCWSMCRLQPHL